MKRIAIHGGMTTAWLTRSAALSSALIFGVAVTAFASCATNVVGEPAEDDAASSVPETSTPPSDAGLDASCDASDPGCTTEVMACETVAWCLTSAPMDPRHTLTDVWGTSKEDVWAVGSGGAILHHDGDAWTLTPSGHVNTFHKVWGSGPNDVWVVSTTSVVLHGTGFRNGSASWRNVSPKASSTTHWSSQEREIPLHAVWGTSVHDVRLGGRPLPMAISTGDFAYGGAGNQFAKSRLNDGGTLWRALPGKDFVVRTIWGSGADDVWMAGDDGVTVHGTRYDGELPNPELVDGAGTCDKGCYRGCTACAIASDALVWAAVDSQSNVSIESVWGSSASDVWAVGERGTIRRFRTGDVRWQKIESPTQQTLRAVWGSGPDDVWIVGDGGTILHYDGNTIEPSSVQLPLGPKPDLRGVWGSGPDDVWVVGDQVVLHYTGPKPGISDRAGAP